MDKVELRNIALPRTLRVLCESVPLRPLRSSVVVLPQPLRHASRHHRNQDIRRVALGQHRGRRGGGEKGAAIDPRVRAATAVSVPFDLARSSRHIDKGLSRIYSRRFLRSLKIKALAKIARHPGIANPRAVAAAPTLWDFDDVFTGPVHGFASAEDYYARSSSIHFLSSIRIPTLLLSARDDPFHPAGLLDEVERIARDNPSLAVEFVERGGHVGFIEGATPWSVSSYAERRAVEFGDSVLAMSRSGTAY